MEEMVMEDLLVGIGTLLSAGAVAAIAAFLGVRAGLRKLRLETSFERRLTWCEQTMNCLNEAGTSIVRAAHFEPRDAAEDLWGEALRSYEALLPYCAQKELYASTAAFQAIQAAMEAMQSLLRQYYEETGDSRTAAAACQLSLQHAVTALAKEARAHLGFEPLDPTLLKPERRFLHYVPKSKPT